MTNKKKKIVRVIGVIAIAGCVAIGSAYYYVSSNAEEEVQYIYKESTVERGDLVLGIEESGSVTMTEAELDYDLEIDTGDDDDEDDDDDDEDDDDATYDNLEIEDVYVAMGQTIAEGDALFKLSEKSVSSVKNLLEANQTEASITLAQAKQEYETGELEASDTQNESEVAASNADEVYEASIDELEAEIENYEGQISVLTNDIETLQEELADEDFLDELSDAKTAYESAKSVFEETDSENGIAYVANQADYESAKSTYESLLDQQEQYEEDLEDKQTEIETVNTSLEEANTALDLKKAEASNTQESTKLTGDMAGEVYDNSVSSLKEAVSEAQDALDTANTQLEDFENFVGDDGIIYADGSGVVTAVNYEEGDELTETGAMLTYTASDDYTVSIDISEEDITDVAVGDSVSIEFAAYEDTPYDGKVTAISTSSSEDHSTTVSYAVTVEIEGDTSILYGGMTADVTFVTDSVSDVLYVSSTAIVEQNGKSYVYVKSGDGYTLQEVETGFSNGSETEITSGLSEGDSFYIVSTSTMDEESLMSGESSSDTATENASAAQGASESTGTQSGGMPSGGEMPSGGGMPGQ